jgi:hypothetical protein
MMVAWDPANPEDHGPPALASERIREIDAVSATYNDQTGEMSVDLSALLGASGYLIYLLAGGLANRYENVTPLDILAHLREQIDDPGLE